MASQGSDKSSQRSSGSQKQIDEMAKRLAYLESIAIKNLANEAALIEMKKNLDRSENLIAEAMKTFGVLAASNAGGKGQFVMLTPNPQPVSKLTRESAVRAVDFVKAAMQKRMEMSNSSEAEETKNVSWVNMFSSEVEKKLTFEAKGNAGRPHKSGEGTTMEWREYTPAGMLEFLMKLVKGQDGDKNFAGNLTTVLQNWEQAILGKRGKIMGLSTQNVYSLLELYTENIVSTGKSEKTLLDEQDENLRVVQIKAVISFSLDKNWTGAQHFKNELISLIEKDNSNSEEALKRGEIFSPSDVFLKLNELVKRELKKREESAPFTDMKRLDQNIWAEKKDERE